MTRSVLVTGGCGMLGGDLARCLAADGWRVRTLDVRAPAEAVAGVEHQIADVRDPQAVRNALSGMDTVVHTASALPSYPAKEIHSIVVTGTRNVLTAARDAGVARAVHVSSTAVYGLPTVVPTTEEYPREPVDPYSRAKVEAEEVAEKIRAEGLCLPILRPKTFLGPGRMGLFSMLFEWAEEGRNFPVLGRGDVRVQMLAVDDLIEVLRIVLTAPDEIVNDTYNIAAADFGTLREDFQAVLDAAGHGKRVVSIPGRPAAAVLDLLARANLSPVYRRLAHKLLSDSYVSVEKARTRLGFQPRKSNQDAILDTFRWWHANRSRSGGPVSVGRTSIDPWRQGALRLVKAFF